jgi:hypothetical protein
MEPDKSPTVRRGKHPSAPFAGRWRNELGSVMTLKVSRGIVSGNYTSRVSGDHKPVSGTVTGRANGYVIAFVVAWPRSEETGEASLTAWVGQFVRERGREVIQTLWHLTEEVDDLGDPLELWRSVTAGADRFTRIRRA